MPDTNNPLIVQSDKTVLLEVDNPRYEAARDALARFAELVKSPEQYGFIGLDDEGVVGIGHFIFVV